MLSFNHCNDFSYVHESILFLFLLLQLSLNLGSFAMYESNCMLLTVTGLWVHTEHHPGQGELRAFEKASFCLKKKQLRNTDRPNSTMTWNWQTFSTNHAVNFKCGSLPRLMICSKMLGSHTSTNYRIGAGRRKGTVLCMEWQHVAATCLRGIFDFKFIRTRSLLSWGTFVWIFSYLFPGTYPH